MQHHCTKAVYFFSISIVVSKQTSNMPNKIFSCKRVCSRKTPYQHNNEDGNKVGTLTPKDNITLSSVFM